MDELHDLRKPVFVFSHPNHEIAVFGMLIKLKPSIIYLTDGGGGNRLRETSEGLYAAGVGEVSFLNYPEQTFYDALTEKNVSFFADVCDRIRAAMGQSFDSIFCDAVEWYNPVHDLTLPMVRKVARDLTLLYEVPLIHLTADGFVFQRAAQGRRSLERRYELPEEVLDRKERAWKETYRILYEQFGPMLGDIRTVAKSEAVMPAGDPERDVDQGAALRYDERGQTLYGDRAITREKHYLPLVRALAKA